jgi:hypothetical protein
MGFRQQTRLTLIEPDEADFPQLGLGGCFPVHFMSGHKPVVAPISHALGLPV